MAKKRKWKGAIESWEKVRSLAQRKFVFVLGEDPYFCDRIRQWWLRRWQGRRVTELAESKKEFSNELSRVLMPSVFSVEQAVVAPLIPEVNLIELAVEVGEGEDLVFLGFLGKREVEQSVADWFRRRSKYALIELDVRGRFDRRKIHWAQEILTHLGLLLDDRAIKYLLDWCENHLGWFESEATKLKLLTNRAVGVIGVNFLERYWPRRGNYDRDIDKMAGGHLNSYFYHLNAAYRGAESVAEKKQVLSRHLRLLEQMRLLAFADRGKPVKDQIDQLRKLSRFPMTEGRVEYLLKTTQISSRDVLRFLYCSAEWIRENFIYV